MKLDSLENSLVVVPNIVGVHHLAVHSKDNDIILPDASWTFQNVGGVKDFRLSVETLAKYHPMDRLYLDGLYFMTIADVVSSNRKDLH